MIFRGAIGTKSLMLITLFLLVLLSQPIDVKNSSAIVEDNYSPETLFLTVYADGRVDVEYLVLVDPPSGKC